MSVQQDARLEKGRNIARSSAMKHLRSQGLTLRLRPRKTESSNTIAFCTKDASANST